MPGAAGDRVCRVQPDIPAVGRFFDYVVPGPLAADLQVGSVVRVPLHGRRVRGWVVADDVDPATARDRLVAVQGVVSAGPPPEVVALCRWAAWRWAGPLPVLLRAASPPLRVPPGAVPEPRVARYASAPPPGGLGEGWGDRDRRVLVWPPGADRRDLATFLLAPEGSTLVVVPEPARAGALVAHLARAGRHVLHHHSQRSDRERRDLWVDASRGSAVVVGGRGSVLLPVPDLASVVVLDEGDEALQEERAPTWHARDLAAERARRVGAAFTMVSPAPSLEARRSAAVVVPAARVLRAGWPRLEVVDLRREPPGVGLLAEALGPALHRALEGQGRAICVVNRRGRARLLACRACQALARCATCGAAVAQPEHDLACPRCDARRPPVCIECGAMRFRAVRPGLGAVRDDLAALVPRVPVAEVDAGNEALPDAPVLVGTEAVLHRVTRVRSHPVRLVAFLAFDEELLAPRFRAHEQALWLLVRAARLLGPRSAGGVLLVQTRLPEHQVLQAAASGDPERFARLEESVRDATRFPPASALAELSGADAAVALAVDGARAAGLEVLGPTGGRALVRAPSIEVLCDGLARVDLAAARAAGRLRVSVDPPRV